MNEVLEAIKGLGGLVMGHGTQSETFHKFLQEWRAYMDQFKTLQQNVAALGPALTGLQEGTAATLASLTDLKGKLDQAQQNGLDPAEVQALADQVGGVVTGLEGEKAKLDAGIAALNPPAVAAEAAPAAAAAAT